MKTIKIAKLMTFIFLISSFLSLIGCSNGNSIEKQLPGEWCLEGSSTVQFEFFSDGTCTIRGTYGTGRWNFLDGKLKITDFYGETQAVDIVACNNDNLIIESNGSEVTLVKKS